MFPAAQLEKATLSSVLFLATMVELRDRDLRSNRLLTPDCLSRRLMPARKE